MIPTPNVARGRYSACRRYGDQAEVPEYFRVYTVAMLRQRLAALAASYVVELTPAERRELAEICRRLLGTTKPAATDEAA